MPICSNILLFSSTCLLLLNTSVRQKNAFNTIKLNYFLTIICSPTGVLIINSIPFSERKSVRTSKSLINWKLYYARCTTRGWATVIPSTKMLTFRHLQMISIYAAKDFLPLLFSRCCWRSDVRSSCSGPGAFPL